MKRAVRLPSRRLALALLTALTCLAPAEALAHKVNLFATVEEGQIVGKVYFRGGPPAQNVTVTATDASGREVGKAETDSAGRFRIDIRYRGETKLVADAGDGHGADFTLKAEELPEGLPVAENSPTPVIAPTPAAAKTQSAALPADKQLQELRGEIVRLREQLDGFQSEIRLRDLLGGIGYILGLSGVAFYFLSRRKTV